MHRLRVKFRRKTLDVWRGDPGLSSLELHPGGKVVKPLDHRHECPPSGYRSGRLARIVVRFVLSQRSIFDINRFDSQHAISSESPRTAALHFPCRPDT
jgi:hypothetical protein